MRRRLRIVLELAALAGVALLVALPRLVAREVDPPRAGGLTPEAAIPSAVQSPAGSVLPLADPVAVAALFRLPERTPAAARAAPAAVETPPEPEAPAEAEWLRVVGSATEESGRRVFFLKDTRSGKLLRAAPGATGSEWELVAADERSIDVRNGEEVYRVPLR